MRLAIWYGEAFRVAVCNMETITPNQVSALAENEGTQALSPVACTTGGRDCLLVRCRMV